MSSMTIRGVQIDHTDRLEWLAGLAPQTILAVQDDFRDPDDTVSKVLLRALQLCGAPVTLAGFVANMAPAGRRAAMANATVYHLGFPPEVRTGIGTDCNRTDAPKPYEYNPGFARLEGLVESGQELLVHALEAAPDKSVTLLLTSGCTDGRDLLRSRPDLSRRALRQVVHMGGVEMVQTPDPAPGQPERTKDSDRILPDPDGLLLAQKRASNNAFDFPAAQELYRQVQVLEIPLTVLTRHAAWGAPVPAGVYDRLAETGHPVALELKRIQKAALDDIWEQIHLSPDDPKRTFNKALTPAWFRKQFFGSAEIGLDRGGGDEVWDLVKEFALFDAATALAAFPELRLRLFDAAVVEVRGVRHEVIGLSPAKTGVKNPPALRDFMIALMFKALARN